MRIPPLGRLNRSKLLMTLLLISLLIISIEYLEARPLSGNNHNEYLSYVTSNISLDNIMRHIINLTSLGSRYTGYSGSHQTAAYICHYLRDVLGFEVWVESYEALIPYDDNSTLSIVYPLKKTLKVYALAPNAFDLCKSKVKGELVYLGKGDLNNLRSKDVANKIVLLDFNSGASWLSLKDFGARAVIFIEPHRTTIEEASLKVLNVPLKFPRALIKLKDAEYLLRLLRSRPAIVVELNLNVMWRRAYLTNVLAYVSGTNKDSRMVMLATEYDTYSIVPKISPGIDDAINVAALLEFARMLREARPKRSLLIVAFSGAAIAMAGARHFLSRISPTLCKRIKFVFTLDLSAETPFLALLAQGSFYGRFRWWGSPIHPSIEGFLSYIMSIGDYDPYKSTYIIHGKRYYVDLIPSYYGRRSFLGIAHLAELFNHAGIPALTFYTIGKSSYWLSSDITNDLELRYIQPQLELAYFILYSLLNDSSESIDLVLSREDITHSWGLGSLEGKARYFNKTNLKYEDSWSTVLEDQHIIIAYIRDYERRHQFLVEVDRNGTFEVFGLKKSSWWLSGWLPYEISLFVIDNRTSKVLYASKKMNNILIRRQQEEVNVVLYRCSTVAIHGALLDPSTFYPIDVDTKKGIRLLRSGSIEEILEFNFYVSELSDEKSGVLGRSVVIFIPADLRVDIFIMGSKGYGLVASLKDVALRQGEYLDVYPWEVAKGILKLTEEMLMSLRKEPTLRESLTFATIYYEEALKDYEECIESLSKKDYLSAFALVYHSLYSARKAYNALKETRERIAAISLLMLCLIIPFALIVEELLLASQGFRKVLYVTLILSLTAAVLMITHPGFRLHSNPFMVIWGLLASSAIFLSFMCLASESFRALKELRRIILGKHFLEYPWLDVSLAMLSISLRNLKKRPLRTTLMLLTVTSMVVSTILFASLKRGDIVVVREVEGVHPQIAGLLIKEIPIDVSEGGVVTESPLSYCLVDYVRGYFGKEAEIYPRARLRKPISITCKRTGRTLTVYEGVIGLTPKDPVGLSRSLSEGGLFEHDESLAVVLSEDIKEILKVEVGDTIFLGGWSVTVIGVISGDIFRRLVDIDGYPVTPLFITKEGIIQESNFLVVLPFRLLIKMGGVVTSILVHPVNASNEYILAKAKELSKQISAVHEMYYSDGVKSYSIGCIRGYELTRTESFLIPFALICLILSTNILGSVYERRRELSTYASLGLSPTHIALVALTEGLSYSLIGVVTGYVVATSASMIGQLIGYNVPIDVSSPHLVLTLLLSVVAVIISSLYPAFIASRSVTPSLQRRWSASTRPLGNEWYIPLPFRVGTLGECIGAMRYLAEYLKVIHSRKFEIVGNPVIKREGYKTVTLIFKVRLAPHSATALANFEVIAKPSQGGKLSFAVRSKLERGERQSWLSLSRKLVDHLRKQLLLWRALNPSDRDKYILPRR